MTDTATEHTGVDRTGAPLVEMRNIRVAFGGVHVFQLLADLRQITHDDCAIGISPREIFTIGA